MRSRAFESEASGSAAVEFALVAPVLLLLVFGVLAVCAISATLNGLEQIAAGAARSTVAGLSDTERTSLATNFVNANASAYPYINVASLGIVTLGNPTARTFTVVVSYDVSKNAVLATARSVFPQLPTTLTRSSVAIEGGS